MERFWIILSMTTGFYTKYEFEVKFSLIFIKSYLICIYNYGKYIYIFALLNFRSSTGGCFAHLVIDSL